MCNYTLSLHFESPNSCCPPSALQTASCREAHPEEHVIFKVMTTSERREQQKFSLGRVNELIGQYKHKETPRKKKEKMQKDRRGHRTGWKPKNKGVRTDVHIFNCRIGKRAQRNKVQLAEDSQ